MSEPRTRNARRKAQRAVRQAAERDAAAARARRERVRMTSAVVATLLVVVTAVVLLTVVSGDSETDQTARSSQVVDEAGLQIGPPPWPSRTEGFVERVSALGFPPVGDESYHAHALLSVFRNGAQVAVPPVLGFSADGQHSSLHTHYPNGVIHLEADDPYPYTIRDVFTVWGVRFSATQLGGDTAAGSDAVHVLVNGKPAGNGPETEIKDGDNIVVAFGEPGSFPVQPDLAPLRDELGRS